MKDIILVNIKTAEIITKDSPIKAISDALEAVYVKEKPLSVLIKGLKALLEPEIDRLLEEGENKLANFWLLQRGRREFSKDKFDSEASEAEKKEHEALKLKLAELEEKYKAFAKPYVKHPKYD